MSQGASISLLTPGQLNQSRCPVVLLTQPLSQVGYMMCLGVLYIHHLNLGLVYNLPEKFGNDVFTLNTHWIIVFRSHHARQFCIVNINRRKKRSSALFRVRPRLHGSGQIFARTPKNLHGSTLCLHRTGGTGRILERLSVQVWDLLFPGPKLAHLAVQKIPPVPPVPCKRKVEPCKFLSGQKFVRTRVNRALELSLVLSVVIVTLSFFSFSKSSVFKMFSFPP